MLAALFNPHLALDEFYTHFEACAHVHQTFAHEFTLLILGSDF